MLASLGRDTRSFTYLDPGISTEKVKPDGAVICTLRHSSSSTVASACNLPSLLLSHARARLPSSPIDKASMRSPLSEVLLSSSSALTAIHDLRTGALLTSFKASSSSAAANTSGDQISRDSAAATSSSSASAYRKTVDVIEARDGQAGIIVAAVPGKAAITVWSFQRVCPTMRKIGIELTRFFMSAGSTAPEAYNAYKGRVSRLLEGRKLPRGRRT